MFKRALLTRGLCGASGLAVAVLTLAVWIPAAASAQERGTPYGEWRYQSADAWGTRFSPVNQITAENFGQLEQAWLFRGDNFGPNISTWFGTKTGNITTV